jgi:DtxR family Mn-dependent transcriptional regulator
MAIKRLKRDGLIEVGGEGHIFLTEPGREIANRLLHRHHLIERMLTEVFGLEWYKVHDEAEQLEHAVSTDFEQKLVEKLGHDGVCPHGNIVGADSPAARRKRGLKPLDEARAGEHVTVSSVFERDRRLLEHLDSMGVRPGARLDIEQAAPDVRFTADGRDARLDRDAAGKVWVR